MQAIVVNWRITHAVHGGFSFPQRVKDNLSATQVSGQGFISTSGILFFGGGGRASPPHTSLDDTLLAMSLGFYNLIIKLFS